MTTSAPQPAGPIEHSLSPLQQQIVQAPAHGEIIVGGVAGSGKTIAAVHRAAHLCANTPRHKNEATVLFLCYNRPLAREVQKIVSSFPSSIWRRVAVRTVHQWCWPYVRRQLPGHTVIKDVERIALVREALRETRYRYGNHDVFERSPQVVLDEIRLIKGCGLIDVDEYLDRQIARIGTLDVEEYRLIFAVAETYGRMLRERCQVDYDDYAHIALSVVEQSREPARYDHVIIDECQDLSTTQIELGRRLARQSLLLIADQEQMIYRVNRLPETLPTSTLYDLILPESFRTTAQIFDVARRLLPDQMQYPLPRRQGPPPVYRAFRWVEDEAGFIGAIVADLLSKGIAPAQIAVLARQRDVLPPIVEALRQRHIPVADDDRQEQQEDTPGVVATTIFLAKGREFRAVVVPALVEGVLPRIMPEMDRAAAGQELALARRQLYVAMTRAREWLWLTAGEGPPSRFLIEMGLDQAHDSQEQP
jgi:superfamily I DNA/RNA helicase